jgi:HSP20 family protein
MFTLIPWKKSRSNGAVANLDSHPFDTFRRFDEIFDRYFGNSPAYVPQYAPAWGGDLRESEKEIVVSLDAPGFEANEFDIQTSEDSVTVSAEHVVKRGEETRTERGLKRQIALPSLIDPNKVEAKYRNGVLEIRFMKAEQARWRRVEVKGE